jgi:peptidoglycan/xylan/chitin deacetylase (PgdA/CDA1 family)
LSECAKKAAEIILGSRPILSAGSYLRTPRALVLAFHNVLSEEVEPRGDRSLHLPVTAFCQMVDWLAEAFDIVPLDQVFSSDEEPEGRPRASITFDDAYEGAISVAIPELVIRGLPATVFTIARAEEGQTFWWDALADRYPAGMPVEVRDAALSAGRGIGDEVLDWAVRNQHAIASLEGEFVAAPWSAIDRAAALPGITIASHTASHPNLLALSPVELEKELTGARLELLTRIPTSRPWLSYPYGYSSPAIERQAAQAGYDMAFRVSGGVVSRVDEEPAAYALPRLNIPAGLSLRGFRMRAAGLIRS